MTILDSLKEALQKNAHLRVNKFGEYTPYDLKVIIALFVMSAAYSDGNIHTDERVAMLRTIVKQFDFSDEEAIQILDVAEFLIAKNKDIDHFAREIRDNFEESQRVTLLAMYIKVLEADGVVTVTEMLGLEKVLEQLDLSRDSIDKAKKKITEVL